LRPRVSMVPFAPMWSAKMARLLRPYTPYSASQTALGGSTAAISKRQTDNRSKFLPALVTARPDG
jgi:hypothetical protein